MFRIFNKSRWELKGKSFELFLSVFNELPVDFQYLKEGLTKGVYVAYFRNKSLSVHDYSISFDPTKSDMSMRKGIQSTIHNIIIRADDVTYEMHLSVYDGLWIGFKFSKNIDEIEKFEVDASLALTTVPDIKSRNGLDKLVNELKSGILNLSTFEEINIKGDTYYIIKDLDDGNYIAFDGSGKVFGLIHDSNQIEMICGSIGEFVDEVNCGRFNFDKYLSRMT